MQELTIGETKVAVAQESPYGFLGRLLWYSVRKQTIPHGDFEALLTREGVPRDAWPRRTRPIDAFKTAVRDVQGKDYIVEPETTYDASGKPKTDSKTMLVVSRVRDVVADALPVCMKASFHADTQTLTYDNGSADLRDRVDRAYEVYRNSYRDEDVRKMVTDSLHAAYASNLKQSGGVYFIPEVYAPGIEAVARVIEQLPGCEMVTVPVIDREPERKTLIKQYEKATLERLGELMLQVKDTVDKGDLVVPSVFTRFLNELEYLKEQKGKYEGFLNTAMGKVEVEMLALGSYMGKLASLVKEDKPASAG